MAIQLTRSHQLPVNQARQIVDQVARELQTDLGLSYSWEDNRLSFHRTGIKGYIDVRDNHIEVFIQKNFLLPISDHWLREQVAEHLDRHFPQSP